MVEAPGRRDVSGHRGCPGDLGGTSAPKLGHVSFKHSLRPRRQVDAGHFCYALKAGNGSRRIKFSIAIQTLPPVWDGKSGFWHARYCVRRKVAGEFPSEPLGKLDETYL